MKTYLKEYGWKLCLAVVLIFGQAFCCLSVPACIGSAVSIGIQNKGYSDLYPRVMSPDTFSLLKQLLPEHAFAAMQRSYRLCEQTPASLPERYATKQPCFCFVGDNEEETATLYQNAVMAAICAVRNTNDYERLNYDALLSRISVTAIKQSLHSVTLTDAEKEENYARAVQADAALRIQASAMLLPVIYENAGVDCASNQRAFLFRESAGILLFALGQFACAAAASGLFAAGSAGLESKLRKALRQKILGFSRRTQAAFSPAEIKDLHGSAVTQVGAMISFGGSAVVYSLAITLIGSVITAQKSALFLWLILLCSALIMAVIYAVYRMNYHRYYRMQSQYLAYSSALKTQLQQTITVRAANAQGYDGNRINSLSESVRKDESAVMRAVHVSLNVSSLLIHVLLALTLLLGGASMLRADVTLGDIVTLTQYAVIIVTAILTLGASVIFAPKGLISVRRIRGFLLQEQADETPCGDKTIETVDSVSFDRVKVFECSRPVSFTARRGELTVVTGAAGTGKSTLMDVLCRTCRPAEGTVFINGEALDTLSAAYPSQFVSLAPTRPVLFSDTVGATILLYGGSADESDQLSALRAAVCNFLPEGTDALRFALKNAGEALSGGQRSRLSIACALAKPAQIYLLDDCLTAVDENARRTLLQNLRQTKPDAVVIITTQTPEAIPDAECVVWLENEEGGATNGRA